MKKKVLFIVNPISGTSSKRPAADDIRRYLDAERFDFTISLTECAEYATTLAREAVEAGVDIVVAVGGDGTVNEVARAVVHTPTALGIIPCGSGNGLARHLQIPTTARRAIEIINADTVHTLDYGRMNDRPFFCTCGMGFDADVSHEFARGSKRGPLSYVKDSINLGLKYKPLTYTLTTAESTEQREAFLIACANASQYGNNAYIAPEASMKDGLMDVVVMRPFPTVEGALVALQMFTKTLKSNTHVETFKTRTLHITRPQEGPVHCDGEPLHMGRDITIEIVPRSFNVVVNPPRGIGACPSPRR